MSNCALCIHGHFYQPPRADPLTGRIPIEPSAAPYNNWNERITAECYAPLAERGVFEQISFNLGGTLARWLAQNETATYEQILASERAYYSRHGVGNGLAQPAHHTILPLARRRDKICQVRWGIASFVHRFGHKPAGMWLPEMAVDLETLEVMASEGVHFTILSAEQVQGELTAAAGPYRVRLPGGGEIAVLVRDQDLSNSLSFSMPDPQQLDDWIESQLAPRCSDNLVLIATDGETFGHHHHQGVEVLERILALAASPDYALTALEMYVRDNPPREEIAIVENSAWSCAHGLARWVIGCDCTLGDSRWKGALRRALDNLACDLDTSFGLETARLGQQPWSLRDDYISVVLEEQSGSAFLLEHDLGHISSEQEQRLLKLLDAQFYRQRMYASCTFFFDDLERLEPRYAIGNALRAIILTREATHQDLTPGFRRNLQVAFSEQTGQTGADILDELLQTADKGQLKR